MEFKLKKFKSSSDIPCGLTQSSKVTSSPQNRSQHFMSSPDISTIENVLSESKPSDNSIGSITTGASFYEKETTQSSSTTNVKSVNGQFEESVLSENQTTVVSSESLSENEEDYDEYFKKNQQVARKGLVWKLYKPDTDDTSLYSRMMMNPSDMKHLVTELMLQYKSGADEKVTKELIKFCIQIAGFRNFDIEDYFSTQDYKEGCIALIRQLDEDVIDQPVLMEYGRYLLMERQTNLLKHIKMGFYTFVRSLVNVSHEMEILYDANFMKSFVPFIKYMADSELKCVRHTGVIFVIKMLTGMVLLLNDFLNNPKLRGAEFIQRKTTLECIISGLYFIVYQNCRVTDKTLSSMKLECIQESKIWIKHFPKMFGFNLQFFNLLIQLLSDQTQEIRLATLDIYVYFLRTPRIAEFLDPHAKHLVKAIVERFDDNNENIQVKAIIMFKHVIRRFPDQITDELILKIKDLVFNESAVVGKAAGECLLFYFRRQNQSTISTLVAIATILTNKRKRYCKEFLVESFLHCSSELKEWKSFCKCLVKEEFHKSEIVLIAELFAESVKQVLAGKPTFLRKKSTETSTNVPPIEHQRVADVFGSIKRIMHIYYYDAKTFTSMVKIINQIDYQQVKKNFEMELIYMAEIIVKAFECYTYKPTLIQITIFFDVICNIPSFKERANLLAKAVCKNSRQYLLKLLADPEEDEDAGIFRVVLLYKYFDFNQDGLLTFDYLARSLENFNLQSVSELLMIMKWNLIWNLKTLIGKMGKRLNLTGDIKLLSSASKEYLLLCLKFIIQSTDKKLTAEMLITMREFIVMFTKKLNDAMIRNKDFLPLKLKIDDANLQNKLGGVLKDIITDASVPLVDRRNIVNGYIEMVNCRIISPEAMVNVYRYFNSHNYEFGSIIETSLNMLSICNDPNIIYFAILHTLFHVYDEIISKNEVFDIKSREGIQLNLLAKRFSTYKFLHDRLKLFKLLSLILQNIIRDPPRLNLLFVLKHFVYLLKNVADKEFMLKIFQKHIKDDYKTNDAVLYFEMILKPKIKPPEENPFPIEQIKRKNATDDEDSSTESEDTTQDTNKDTLSSRINQLSPGESSSQILQQTSRSNTTVYTKKAKAIVSSQSDTFSNNNGLHSSEESSNIIQNQQSPLVLPRTKRHKAEEGISHNIQADVVSTDMSEVIEVLSDLEISVMPKSKNSTSCIQKENGHSQNLISETIVLNKIKKNSGFSTTNQRKPILKVKNRKSEKSSSHNSLISSKNKSLHMSEVTEISSDSDSSNAILTPKFPTKVNTQKIKAPSSSELQRKTGRENIEESSSKIQTENQESPLTLPRAKRHKAEEGVPHNIQPDGLSIDMSDVIEIMTDLEISSDSDSSDSDSSNAILTPKFPTNVNTQKTKAPSSFELQRKTGRENIEESSSRMQIENQESPLTFPRAKRHKAEEGVTHNIQPDGLSIDMSDVIEIMTDLEISNDSVRSKSGKSSSHNSSICSKNKSLMSKHMSEVTEISSDSDSSNSSLTSKSQKSTSCIQKETVQSQSLISQTKVSRGDWDTLTKHSTTMDNEQRKTKKSGLQTKNQGTPKLNFKLRKVGESSPCNSQTGNKKQPITSTTIKEVIEILSDTESNNDSSTPISEKSTSCIKKKSLISKTKISRGVWDTSTEYLPSTSTDNEKQATPTLNDKIQKFEKNSPCNSQTEDKKQTITGTTMTEVIEISSDTESKDVGLTPKSKKSKSCIQKENLHSQSLISKTKISRGVWDTSTEYLPSTDSEKQATPTLNDKIQKVEKNSPCNSQTENKKQTITGTTMTEVIEISSDTESKNVGLTPKSKKSKSCIQKENLHSQSLISKTKISRGVWDTSTEYLPSTSTDNEKQATPTLNDRIQKFEKNSPCNSQTENKKQTITGTTMTEVIEISSDTESKNVGLTPKSKKSKSCIQKENLHSQSLISKTKISRGVWDTSTEYLPSTSTDNEKQATPTLNDKIQKFEKNSPCNSQAEDKKQTITGTTMTEVIEISSDTESKDVGLTPKSKKSTSCIQEENLHSQSLISKTKVSRGVWDELYKTKKSGFRTNSQGTPMLNFQLRIGRKSSPCNSQTGNKKQPISSTTIKEVIEILSDTESKNDNEQRKTKQMSGFHTKNQGTPTLNDKIYKPEENLARHSYSCDNNKPEGNIHLSRVRETSTDYTSSADNVTHKSKRISSSIQTKKRRKPINLKIRKGRESRRSQSWTKKQSNISTAMETSSDYVSSSESVLCKSEKSLSSTDTANSIGQNLTIESICRQIKSLKRQKEHPLKTQTSEVIATSSKRFNETRKPEESSSSDESDI